MSILASQIWDVFQGNNHEAMEKVAAMTEDFIRDRIREVSAANRVIPPVVLTEAQIERNTDNDWPLKRVEIEPDSKAMTLGFRGKGEAKFFDGKKYEVYFNKIEAEHFKKTKEELMTMRYPVMDVINNNIILDMQEQLDGMFVKRLEAAALASGNKISDTTNTTLTKEILIDAAQLIVGKRRRGVRLVMTEARFMDLMRLNPDKIGYDHVGRLAFDGVREVKKFGGFEVITTINSSTAGSVWDDKVIWLVAEPQWLGSNFILGDVTQEMKREGNMLEWWAWQDQGIEIGNINGLVRINLKP